MMEQLLSIKDAIIAFWNKYTPKQKTVIICVACAILLAIVLLAYFMTRPGYDNLVSLSCHAAVTYDKALQSAEID